MRRPHALLALPVAPVARAARAAPAALAALAAPLALVVLAVTLGLAACGGNDKPPLTPDNLEPMTDSPEGGATPAATGPATPPTPPK